MSTVPYVDPHLVDPAVLKAAVAYSAAHTGGNSRATAEQPNPPYPSPDNPMLQYLIEGAHALYQSGTDLEDVILQAVVHAWYEGNIEGREQAGLV